MIDRFFVWLSIAACKDSNVTGSLQTGHSLLLINHLQMQFKCNTCPHLSCFPFSILNWHTIHVGSLSSISISSRDFSGKLLNFVAIEALWYKLRKIQTMPKADSKREAIINMGYMSSLRRVTTRIKISIIKLQIVTIKSRRVKIIVFVWYYFPAYDSK